MLIAGSILPYVISGLGILVIVLLIVLSVLLFWIICREHPHWKESDVVAAREAPVVKGIPNSKSHWRAAPEPAWADRPAAVALSKQLMVMSFDRVGAFAHNGKGTIIVLFVISPHHAAAWIEENSEGKIDLTVCSWTAEGAPIRVTTVKNESSFVLLEGELRQIAGSLSPKDLCRQLGELRAGRALYPVTAESVVENLNREERKRARRFSQDPETVDLWGMHLLKANIKDKETGDRISGKMLQSVFLSQLGDTITDCCLETFAEESRISATDWTRLQDRFLVVHDRLSTKELKNLEVWNSLSGRDFRRIKPILKKQVPAREAFAALNSELPHHLRYTEVGRVSDPVEATVYLAS